MKDKLHWGILYALILSAITAGIIKGFDLEQNIIAIKTIGLCDLLGKLFINALKMVVVPLIVSSIICGVMGLGSQKDFGRLGLKTVFYYTTTAIIAVFIGLILVNLLQPGKIDPETAQKILGSSNSLPAGLLEKIKTSEAHKVTDLFLRMVPQNIVAAATNNGQLLGLITFSLVFGFFIGKLPLRLRIIQKGLWEGIQQIMLSITDLIITFAPIGVFGLVTPIITRTGFDLILPVLNFFFTVCLGLFIFFTVVLGAFLKFFAKINPIQHYKAMLPVLLTAFSTASSSSTLPVTLDAVEKTSKISNKTASFTLPLGATVNMSGTALYECIVVLFIAQLYNVTQGLVLSFTDQMTVVVMALITSVGVAGIPAASLVAITMILAAVGLPLESVGVIWIVERISDMLRTAVNVFSDTCGAVIIAKSEGEKTAYK